jgi:large subunit ribosomal protein L4
MSVFKLNSSATLPQSLLDFVFNETLVHQVVTSIMTNDRAGTKKQKTRSEVRGGGRKPKAQKGGGARIGTIRSPLCRGGGVTFAARPRSFNQKINKKMYQYAMRCIIAQLVREERLTIIDDIKIDRPSTKNIAAALKQADFRNALLITESLNENLYLSMRNIPCVAMATMDIVNPIDLISFDKVVMTVAAAKICGERFA